MDLLIKLKTNLPKICFIDLFNFINNLFCKFLYYYLILGRLRIINILSIACIVKNYPVQENNQVFIKMDRTIHMY